MSKIYVIQGSAGEYSDHREWMVRAYKTEAAAQAEVVRLTQCGNAFRVVMEGKREDDDWSWEFGDEAKALKSEFDPEFNYDYCGFNYNFYEVDLLDE